MMLHLIKRLGLPGVLGLVLLAGAAWVQGVWLPEQKTQAEALASKARQLRHELLAKASPGAASQARALTPEAAWQALWQQLPDSSQRTALQSAVLVSARERGLTLAAVQFKGGPEGPPGLWRQRLVMPVDGRYADVRAWLGQLLSEPALSLDAVDLQRTDVMGDAIKARVSVSLWWRTTGGPR
ncbi:hypothetical protein [Aquabacterium sp.]|uniref:hypothetical protein n=1 Tax=Aquabacterium sp. TaxID=1872578 RepID=UPI00198ABB09|nr:hypothetical protein [Aquabacterium sp.]MBC7702032.1 hypothetical protein [Aquabacterium sp.]